jgi:hypothetical protein
METDAARQWREYEIEAFARNSAMLNTPHGRALFTYGDAFQIAAGLFGRGRIPIACGEHAETYASVLRAFHADDWSVRISPGIFDGTPAVGYVQLNPTRPTRR